MYKHFSLKVKMLFTSLIQAAGADAALVLALGDSCLLLQSQHNLAEREKLAKGC